MTFTTKTPHVNSKASAVMNIKLMHASRELVRLSVSVTEKGYEKDLLDATFTVDPQKVKPNGLVFVSSFWWSQASTSFACMPTGSALVRILVTPPMPWTQKLH
jgi:hypothetical protein